MVCDHIFNEPKYKNMIQKKKIIMMVPYPAQGHVSPMMKLASSLSTLGFQPLIILPEFIHRRIIAKADTAEAGIVCVSIPDGLDDSKPYDFFAIEMAMEDHMPAYLGRMIRKLNEDDHDEVVACLIVDLLASWAIDVGKNCGVAVAGFWPAMAATYALINAIPDLVRRGVFSESGLPQLEGSISFEPDQPLLNVEEMPWLIGTSAAKKARFKFWARTMDRSSSLRWVLVNSFPNESRGSFSSMKWAKSPKCGPSICPIGPLRTNEWSERPTLWEEDSSCLDWLDPHKPNSVVYISFGSWVSPIGETKIRSLALALEDLGRPFIWVLGPAWRAGLPNGFIKRVAWHGKIVEWAPQVDVLQHKAVGCYLTHCGWNSTMEAIQCRKSLLCFPVAGDQFLNCEYIVNVWKIGVKINGFGNKDVDDGIQRVMEDKEMKRRIVKLNEKILGEEAMTNTKDNLLSFVNHLKTPFMN